MSDDLGPIGLVGGFVGGYAAHDYYNTPEDQRSWKKSINKGCRVVNRIFLLFLLAIGIPMAIHFTPSLDNLWNNTLHPARAQAIANYEHCMAVAGLKANDYASIGSAGCQTLEDKAEAEGNKVGLPVDYGTPDFNDPGLTPTQRCNYTTDGANC